MNIKRAKQEIKNTIQVYLTKNAHGEYEIPSMRQRLDRIITFHLHSYPTATCVHHSTC